MNLMLNESFMIMLKIPRPVGNQSNLREKGRVSLRSLRTECSSRSSPIKTEYELERLQVTGAICVA